METKRHGEWPLVAVLALGLVSACQDKGAQAPSAQAPAATADPFQLPESDVRIIAAREMARVSALGFIDALRSPKPSYSGFALRAAGPGGQPVWLGDILYDGHTFKGRVGGTPYQPAPPGAEMKVKRADITDWMYLDGGKMVGGFTVRAIRDSLPPDKRAEFEKRLPFRIE